MPDFNELIRRVARDFSHAPHWHLLAVLADGSTENSARALAQWLALRPAARRLPDGPQRLTLTVVLPAAPAWAQVSAALQALAGDDAAQLLRHLAPHLASQWHGLLPGLHALALGDGDRLLLMVIGTPADDAPAHALAELHGAAHGIALFGSNALARLLKALPPLCQPQARIWLEDAAAAARPDVQQALRASGMQADEANPPNEMNPPNPPAAFFRHAPRWQPRERVADRLAAPMPRVRGCSMSGTDAEQVPSGPGRCFIVGAGLAAASLACSLAARGWQVAVLSAGEHMADGASGLPAGVVAEHVSPDDCTLSRLTRAGARATLERAARLLPEGEGASWAITGVLERHAASERRLPESWAAHATPTDPANPGIAPASAAQQAQAGLPEATNAADTADTANAANTANTPNTEPPLDAALWHARAGWVRPPEFIAAQLATPGVRWRGGQRVARIARAPNGPWQALDAQGQPLAEADLAIVAAGFDTRALLTASFADAAALPLTALRGQAAFGATAAIQSAEAHALPPFPVNGHGNFIANAGGLWMTGSTFERGNANAETSEAGHAANWQRLAELLPAAARALQGDWPHARRFAAVRCAAPDRLPFIGPLPPAFWRSAPEAPPAESTPFEAPWAYAGLGARGIALCVLTAEIATCWLHDEPLPIEKTLARRLLAARLKAA